ncbi:MAG TPA: endonuclease domain-containing protein [Anaerolineales bacterium]|nr:endonuclease domain-containing protein [Anaerolineales bacterium]
MLTSVRVSVGNQGISRDLKDQLIEVARRMRAEPTLAEQRLWHHLRELQLGGFKFRHQHIINRFIVDFYCPEVKLAIEVDGPVHKKQRLQDEECEAALRDLGYQVMRFSNEEVFMDLPTVLNRILSSCAEVFLANHQQSPFPFQGEG